MRNPLSDTIVTIKPSGIRKFFDIVSEMEDAISLGVGEPDFDTPWHIRDEGIYSLEKGRTFYTSNAGLKQLREEIAHYLRRRYQVSYDPLHEIMITVGGSEAIDIALRAMVNPGDEVLIPQPSYVSYEPCAVLAGAKPVIIPLKAENEFRLTAQETKPANTRKGFYPDDIAGTFGVPVEEHLKESEVKQMDGYVSVGMLTGKTVPDTGLD